MQPDSDQTYVNALVFPGDSYSLLHGSQRLLLNNNQFPLVYVSAHGHGA